jgi:hypothetical protein
MQARQQKMLEQSKNHDTKQEMDFRHTKSVTIENNSSQVLEFDTDVEKLDSSPPPPATAAYNEELLVEQARAMLKHPRYPHVISMVIIVHCVAMAGDRYDAPQEWHDYAKIAYVVCNICFGLDLIVRLFAFQGQPGFFSSSLNTFELAMLFFGVVGLVLNLPLLMLLPSFRLYRLMRYLPTLEHLMFLAVGSLKALGNLLVFVLVVMTAVTLTGRYVFGKNMTFTRSNFDTLAEAYITAFQLFTGDSWSGVIYAAMASMEEGFGRIYAGIFIVTWFIFSNFIINNLFVAVIIDNFEVAETMEYIDQPGNLAALRKSFSDAWQMLSQKSQAVLRGDIRLDVHHRGEALDPMEDAFVLRDGRDPQQMTLKSAMASKGKTAKRSWLMKVVRWCSASYRPGEQQDDADESVLLCIPPRSRVRRFFIWLGELKIFDAAVYGAIIASCIFLIFAPPGGLSRNDILRIDPSFPAPFSDQTLRWCDYLFTFIFTVEFLVRVLDYGLLFTKRAYLKNGWNIMDSLILLTCWVDLIIEFFNLDQFKGKSFLSPKAACIACCLYRIKVGSCLNVCTRNV